MIIFVYREINREQCVPSAIFKDLHFSDLTFRTFTRQRRWGRYVMYKYEETPEDKHLRKEKRDYAKMKKEFRVVEVM